MWSQNEKRSISSTLTDSEDEDALQNKKPKIQPDTTKRYEPKLELRTNFPNASLYSKFSKISDSANKRAKIVEQADFTLDIKSQFDLLEDASSSKKLKAELDAASSSLKQTFAQKMMNKMGHEPGKGLGRFKQGITEPIEETDQKGKQGIGFKKSGFQKKERESWNFENDQVTEIEVPEWLDNDNKPEPSLESLMTWKKIGPKKRILDDEYHFCSKEVLKQVLDCKSIFDDLENRDLRQARSRSNPFESIAACFFQNRAAMKMANIDAVFDFMFTDPKNSYGESKVEADEPLYFCDVCAGPGGFSEYVLWRKKWMSKGFGFTLKQENDFNLDDFLAGAPEYFETHYGVNGSEGNGDVTITDNLLEFKKFILEQTDNRGVHFMMADGGFSVEGNENIQEILSKQLYLCQFLCALMVVRVNGNFVCKLFDIFTPFSVGLIYLLYLCFDRICIHKPVTSRPANSERYIICEGARNSKEIVEQYLLHVNEELHKYFRDPNSKQDVESIVPLKVLKGNEQFYSYIKKSNEKFGKIQCVNLNKIQVFTTNRNLYDTRQSLMYDLCLKHWNIPNLDRSIFASEQEQQQPDPNQRPRGRFFKPKAKYNPNLVNYHQMLNKLYSQARYDLNSLGYLRFRELDLSLWNENFKKSSIFDYKCTFASGNLCLLLSCGRSVVYEFELNSSINCLNGLDNENHHARDWKRLDTNLFNIELPRETLLLAEKCIEYRGEDRAQLNSRAIHIIDVYFIEGQNMIVQNNRVVSLKDRNEQLNIFVKSIQKGSRSEITTVRAREVFDLEKFEENIDNLQIKKSKNQKLQLKYGIYIPKTEDESFLYVSGLYLFKNVASPWSIVRSKRTQQQYYYNSETNKSAYEIPHDYSLYAHPKSYLENGFVWRLKENDEDEHVLTKNNLANIIRGIME